ncbi:MAG: hypothetical protein HS115_15610 [Spirochaetales bacterium]|nr:hypothetical protein [Spirochaetales bacterium]
MIRTSAPGRICLFGEHQDYLGLPVIAMAINLRFFIDFEADRSRPGVFLLNTPDTGEDPLLLDIRSSAPRHTADFCWGIAQVLQREGFSFPLGGQLTLRSEIPIQAGCSSSSAMSAAWLRLLLHIGEHPHKELYLNHPELCAYLVYLGEKVEFQGSGGMMDQYACYLGGLIHVFPEGTTIAGRNVPYGVEVLPAVPGSIYLIDSGVPKDTQGILRNVSSLSRKAIEHLQNAWPDFDLHSTSLDELSRNYSQSTSIQEQVSGEDYRIVYDQTINRNLCQEALRILRQNPLPEEDRVHLGSMLSEEHRLLSQTLRISTPRINTLQQKSVAAGALGAKINGSGGGGTLFAYAPGQETSVERALVSEGVRYFSVVAASGARLDSIS